MDINGTKRKFFLIYNKTFAFGWIDITRLIWFIIIRKKTRGLISNDQAQKPEKEDQAPNHQMCHFTVLTSRT